MSQQSAIELWDAAFAVQVLNNMTFEHKLQFAEMTFHAGWMMIADNFGYDTQSMRARMESLVSQVDDPDAYYADIKTQVILEAMGYGPPPLERT